MESYLLSVTADDCAPIIANVGAAKRRESVLNSDGRYCIDKVIMPFFNSGNQYLPSNDSRE